MMTPAQAIAQLRREIENADTMFRNIVDHHEAPWGPTYGYQVEKALRYATVAHELRGALSVALRGRLPPLPPRKCQGCGCWACMC